ncbi:DUF6578 domain-containing protein [Streptomyces sp. NPDC018019]|uniref:DUF6578 domain-containing protein n=1 Tax=Streptomyces sp. NPDC018019 TaxID=3365030 RepID=UPI003799BF6D
MTDAGPGRAGRKTEQAGGSGRSVRVFYPDWEMECCGTPFSVGDEIAWTLVHEDVAPGDAAVWADCLDERGRLRVATRHGPAPEKGSGAPVVAGRVRSIQVVMAGYRAGERVPGERWLRPVERCPKWFARRVTAEPEAAPGAGPGDRSYHRDECGVIVEVAVARGRCEP